MANQWRDATLLPLFLIVLITAPKGAGDRVWAARALPERPGVGSVVGFGGQEIHLMSRRDFDHFVGVGHVVQRLKQRL